MKQRMLLGILLLVLGFSVVLIDTFISFIMGVIILVGALLVMFLRDFGLDKEAITFTIYSQSHNGIPLLKKHRGYVIYSQSSVNTVTSSFRRLRLNDNTRIDFYGKDPVASSIWVGSGFTPLFVFDNQGVQVYPDPGESRA